MHRPHFYLLRRRACYKLFNYQNSFDNSQAVSHLFFIDNNNSPSAPPIDPGGGGGMDSQFPEFKPNFKLLGGDDNILDFNPSSDLGGGGGGEGGEDRNLHMLASVAEMISAEETKAAILSLDGTPVPASKRSRNSTSEEVSTDEPTKRKRGRPGRRLRLSGNVSMSEDSQLSVASNVSNVSVSTSGGEGSAAAGERKCGKCRNHGVDAALRGHNRDCPFLNCSCHLCSLKDMQRDVVTLQARLRRGYKGRGRGRNAGSIQILQPVTVRSRGGSGESIDRVESDVDSVDLDFISAENGEAVKSKGQQQPQSELVIHLSDGCKLEEVVLDAGQDLDDYRINVD